MAHKKSAPIMFAFLWFLPFYSNAFVVYDPSNYLQNVRTAIQTYQMAAQLRAQFEFLKTEQLGALKGQIDMLKKEGLLHLKNLTGVSEIESLIGENKRMLGELKKADWMQLLNFLGLDNKEGQKEVLAKKYTLPPAPQDLITLFTNELPAQQQKKLVQQANKQDDDWGELKVRLDNFLIKKQSQQWRQKLIQKLGGKLKTLGSKSLLKTQQMIGSELHLLLQQQENLFTTLSSLEQGQIDSQARRASLENKALNAEKNRLLEAVTYAPISESHRTRWGRL